MYDSTDKDAIDILEKFEVNKIWDQNQNNVTKRYKVPISFDENFGKTYAIYLLNPKTNFFC